MQVAMMAPCCFVCCRPTQGESSARQSGIFSPSRNAPQQELFLLVSSGLTDVSDPFHISGGKFCDYAYLLTVQQECSRLWVSGTSGYAR
jgi:hypothetical protein